MRRAEEGGRKCVMDGGGRKQITDKRRTKRQVDNYRNVNEDGDCMRCEGSEAVRRN